jgi:hypothetical protein
MICDQNAAFITPDEPAIKKRRSRDTLLPLANELRYQATSQHQNYFQSSRGVTVTNSKAVGLHYRSKNASEMSHEKQHYPIDFDIDGEIENHNKCSFKDRRIAIKYMFINVFGSPNIDSWHKMKLIPAISHLLNISQNSHTIVLNTLKMISAAEIEYDGKVSTGSGREALILHGTTQANIVCNALEAGLSSKETACLLNMFRENLETPEEPICRSAVQGFMTRETCIKTRKIQAKKSGKADKNCLWARARLAQALQFREQLLLGFLDKNHPDVLNSDLKPLHINGIVFVDEHHEQVVLGSAGVYHHNIARDASGAPTAPDEGGVFSEEKTTTSIKYPGEGRGCFAVAIVTKKIMVNGVLVNGVTEGVRLKPFNYTNRKVITEKAFQFAMNMEEKRVLPLGNEWKTPGYGYKDRYGDNWEIEVRKTVSKHLCSINDIIQHVITESVKAYANTDRAEDFFIFHDGLTCWWTEESQAFIESLGFRDRQLMCTGDTNRGTRYWCKVVGDSPEICRGLDAYGFADFKRFIARMRALTSVYALDDKRRFNFGIPTQVWNTMLRCWTMEPNSDRIIQDIEDFGNVLDKIIEAEGCVIPECRLRHGHRLLSHNNGRVLKHKVNNRQRKHLLKMGSIHPDAKDALAMLLTIGPVEDALEPAEVQVALKIEEMALEDLPVAHQDEEDDFEEDYDGDV